MGSTTEAGTDRESSGIQREDCVEQRGSVEARLRRARERVTALTSEGGEFAVACRESGVRPTPVTDATFDTYVDAERAREAARRYRSALRGVDPDLQSFDLGVCDAAGSDLSVSTVRESTDQRRENGLPRSRRTATVAGDRSDEWIRLENGPVVHISGPDSPLDDELVARQIRAKLNR